MLKKLFLFAVFLASAVLSAGNLLKNPFFTEKAADGTPANWSVRCTNKTAGAVSDGKNILLVLCKGAKKYKASLEKHFVSNDTFNVEILDKGVFYPSDQANFHCGVGVAALKYSKKLNTLYMDRIHTKNDTIFEEENIAYLSDHAVSLAVSE